MTIKNGDTPAMPTTCRISNTNKAWAFQVSGGVFQVPGLTKREMMAMAAMHGLCAHSGDYHTFSDMASDAVNYADALLAELERTQ